MNIKLSCVLAVMAMLVVSPTWGDSQASDPVGSQYNRILYESRISEEIGAEVLIREAYFPPGWQAPRHYHNGNLFIYVIEGEFEVIMEPIGKRTYRSGDALEMKPGVTMDARNPSDKKPLKLSVFQVGKAGDPFVVPVE